MCASRVLQSEVTETNQRLCTKVAQNSLSRLILYQKFQQIQPARALDPPACGNTSIPVISASG